METEDELKELLRTQMPFHFAGEPPPGYGDDTIGTPHVLRHFANIGYGDFDYVPGWGASRSRRSSSSGSRTDHDDARPHASCTRESPAASSSCSPESAT